MSHLSTEQVSLSGKLIALSLPEERDYQGLKDLLNDRETMASLISFFKRSEWTDDQVRERYEIFRQAFSIGSGINWVVHSVKDQVIVGNCGFKDISREIGEAEFGIILSKQLWGKGHALECHLLGLDLGFNQLELSRVYFNTSEANQRMRRFFDKCKIRLFKKIPDDWLQFELLRDEWSDVRRNIKNLLEQKI